MLINKFMFCIILTYSIKIAKFIKKLLNVFIVQILSLLCVITYLYKNSFCIFCITWSLKFKSKRFISNF